MTTNRKLGILIISGVPAIIGGGIIYSVFNTFIYVAVYEIILYLGIISFISKE